MKQFLIGLIVALSFSVFADCPDHYPNKTPIVLHGATELCNSFYVSLYDEANKAVLLTSEHLVKGTAVGSADRLNAFHSDIRVGKSGATNADYTGSGYDKGHMAPAGDSSSPAQMNESFLLTNMTPQEPTLNRIAWKQLEESVRKDFAKSTVDFYVVTIALYVHPTKTIGSNIPVPSAYWKIVYEGDAQKFYFAENKPHAPVTTMTAVDVKKILANQ